MTIPLYLPFDIVTASIAGAVADPDAIKQSVATDDTDPHTYTGTDLDGVLAGGPYTLLRNVSVTTTVSAATYNTSGTIVFTGTDLYGNELVEELVLTAAGGGETVVGTLGFKSVASISVSVQDDTTGFFTFGVTDAHLTDQCVGVRCAGGGDLKVTCNGVVDTIPAVANGETIYISPSKIWAESTVEDITLLIKK